MKFLVLFLILLCTAVSAWAGNEIGNGGDLVAQEFIAAGRKLVIQLREKPDSRIPDVDRLAEAVEKVRVTSTGSLTLHGAEVDAINYPEEREIDVNRPRWQAADPGKRASLVLHEYLGILQVSDLHYEISGSYAEPFVPEERQKNFEMGLGSSFGWESAFQTEHQRSSSPGVLVSAGYLVGAHTEILALFNRQSFGSTNDSGTFTDTFTEYTAGIKYWLTRSKTWRPYVQTTAGFEREKWEDLSTGPADAYGQSSTYYSNYSPAKSVFVMQIATGLRYALLRDVGLDIGLTIHSIGQPWSWSWSNPKILVGNAGLDVIF